MKPSVLFLQERPHRAGAQTCLARLLRHERMQQSIDAVVVSSEKGWLTEECGRFGVRHIEEAFPSSRSVGARLFWNGAFAATVAKRAESLGFRPTIIHANDHPEGLLGLTLAKTLNARRMIFLRSPGMTERDYFKYRCHEYELTIAVGDELQQRTQRWDPAHEIKLIHDGIYASEFALPKPKSEPFPRRLLVIGSPVDWKGWADFTEAMYRLEQEGLLPDIEADFTGTEPDPARNDLKLSRNKRLKCRFLGRVEAFRSLVLQYDLVVNPSRQESFGMAAVETLAAGVPLLSSRTGIIEQVQEQGEFLFVPNSPPALATAFKHLLLRWPGMRIDVEHCQEKIRTRFLIDHTVEKLLQEYTRLSSA
jgi:glycosyltransferase involved in cell wall biosynthesis